MRAVIYARYSCDNQREESIEGQLRECRAFAERKGFNLVGSYIDRAMSAKTDNRPEFQRMIKESGKELFDVIIVWKLDRFARNRYDSAHYKAILRKNGVKVVSATEVISEGAEGIILEAVLEGYAEYYSAELSEKVIRGMTENALKCQYNGGYVPVGYKIDEKKHFQLDELTAPFVKEAFLMYINGRQLKDIAKFFNDNGVLSSRKLPMTITSVSAILQNRRYMGEYRYRDIVVPDGIPPIISKELFAMAQGRLERNRYAPSSYKSEDRYLLTTKLVCSDCGAYMVGESGTGRTGKKYHYYKCVTAKKKCGCERKAVRKEDIEDVVIDNTIDFIFDEEVIKGLADREGYKTFVIPDDVGGRYSVLTAVGLLPIAAAGIDIDLIMKGAQDAREAFMDTDIDNNSCYIYAAIINLLYIKGKKTEMFVSYEPSFAMMN